MSSQPLGPYKSLYFIPLYWSQSSSQRCATAIPMKPGQVEFADGVGNVVLDIFLPLRVDVRAGEEVVAEHAGGFADLHQASLQGLFVVVKDIHGRFFFVRLTKVQNNRTISPAVHTLLALNCFYAIIA